MIGNKLITKQDQKEVVLLKITNSLNLAQEVARIGSWDYDVESKKCTFVQRRKIS